MEIILQRYGQKVILQKEENSVEIRAFLQPMAEKNERTLSTASSIGWVDGRRWMYLGREPLWPGDQLIVNGTVFRVASSRPYYLGRETHHWWAALEREKEADEWGN